MQYHVPKTFFFQFFLRRKFYDLKKKCPEPHETQDKITNKNRFFMFIAGQYQPKNVMKKLKSV